MKVFRNIAGLLIFIGVLTATAAPALAEVSGNPTAWITWRAATYIPSEFSGRALATPGSSIVVAIDLIQNNKVIDLSEETIYWYINGSYLAGGTGLVRTSVNVPDVISQNQISIRASLPQTLGGIAKTITIPVALPQAVITIAPPDPATTDRGLAFDVLAKPYFFTVNDPSQLNVDWTVNNQAPSTFNDPLHLHINIPAGTAPGTKLAVHLRIENITHAFENAVRDLLLNIQ